MVTHTVPHVSDTFACDEPRSPVAVVGEKPDPLDAATLARLSRVDLADMDDAGLVEFAVAWTRVLNHAAGQVARAVADFHDRIDPDEILGPVRLTAAEFGAALRLGSGAADQLVHTAVALTRRFPDTLAAVVAGEVSWPKAVTVAERTAVLTPNQARAVEAVVLPKAADRTPARHTEAVRRAVDRIDPRGAAERRRQAEKDIALVRAHVGDGMGELFARMPSEQLDIVWTAADAWARREKAAGNPRTLDQLRVDALVRWGENFLLGGANPDFAANDRAAAPTRHGRPVTVRVIWDFASLLGVRDHPGELADSGAVLDAATMRRLVNGGVQARRLIIDPNTGELLDLTPDTYALGGEPTRSAVELHVTVPADIWSALRDRPGGDGSHAKLAEALAGAPDAIRAMLAAPLTADTLDDCPDDYKPSAALADFVATRDRHPTNPCAGLTAARAADIDHTVTFASGGRTVRANLTTPVRRWHRLRTHSRWRVRKVNNDWLWTSPTGLTYRTRPHDYRHGP